jgi:hypothetical protein
LITWERVKIWTFLGKLYFFDHLYIETPHYKAI